MLRFQKRLLLIACVVVGVLASAGGTLAEVPLSAPLPQGKVDPCEKPKDGDYRNGCIGHGHPPYHEWYNVVMPNCCHGNECRPTSTRLGNDGKYYFKVDGVECPIDMASVKWLSEKDLELLAEKGLTETTHICAEPRKEGAPRNSVCGQIHCVKLLARPRG